MCNHYNANTTLLCQHQAAARSEWCYGRVLAEGCVAMTSTPVLEVRVRLDSVQCSVGHYAVGVDDG